MPIIRLLSEGEVPVALLSETTQPLAPASTSAIGTSTYAARADHVHPEQVIDITDALSTTNPLPAGTANPGMSVKAAREDHVHPGEDLVLSDDIPLIDGVASAGVSADPSRSDHVHPFPTTAKSIPVDADSLAILDSSDNILKKITFAELVTAFNIRTRLTSNHTLYVRTDGNDSNNGLTNTAGGAFLTIQAALTFALERYDLGGYNLTIQLANGTYTGGISVGSPQTGRGSIIIQGDTTTPSNVILSTGSATCIFVNNGIRLHIRGIKLTSTAYLAFAQFNASIYFDGKMDFGSSSFAQIISVWHGLILIGSNCNITGAGSFFLYSDRGGLIVTAGALTFTISGTLNYPNQFAKAVDGGIINSSGCTFSGGDVTGGRYFAQNNGIIETHSANANYFPGDVAGTTATGGIYG